MNRETKQNSISKFNDFITSKNTINYSKSMYFILEYDYYNLYLKHKDNIIRILFEKCSREYVIGLKNYLEKIFNYKFISIKHLNYLIENNSISKKYSKIAFRHFIIYYENYELLPIELIVRAKNQIKINYKANIDSFVPNNQQIENSIKILKGKDLIFLNLYLFMLQSGCRFSELKYLIKNYDRFKLEQIKNIGIYRNFYLRGKKSSYYLFFNINTFLNLEKQLKEIKIDSFRKFIQENKEIINLKYLRKYNFTLMIKSDISLEIANFIQGRISQNIGFNHYLAKKEIGIKEYSKVINFFSFQ